MGPLSLLSSPSSADEENCYVETPVGIAAVLRSVVATGARAVIYFDDGVTFVHTSVLAVEPRPPAFIFEKGPDAALNPRLLAADEMTLVTADRRVPVQFRFTRPVIAQLEGVEVFRAPLPRRVLRLQRRGYYRLPGNSINALVKCEIVPGEDANKTLHPAVIDLSCGGMCADISPAHGVLADGTRHTCVLDFPGMGRIDTPLIVHNSRDVSQPGAAPVRRYGIEFLNLEARSVALIQRFINDEERRLIRSGRS